MRTLERQKMSFKGFSYVFQGTGKKKDFQVKKSNQTQNGRGIGNSCKNLP